MRHYAIALVALFIIAQGECAMLPSVPFSTPRDVNVVTTVELCNLSNQPGHINLTGPHVWAILNHAWGMCVEEPDCDPEVEPAIRLEDGDGWEMRFVFTREML